MKPQALLATVAAAFVGGIAALALFVRRPSAPTRAAAFVVAAFVVALVAAATWYGARRAGRVRTPYW